MSKEFEHWIAQFEKTPEYLADSFHWADVAKEAFTAGRALGRREVKGEAAQIAGLSACEECVTGVVRDIEAIPEIKVKE